MKDEEGAFMGVEWPLEGVYKIMSGDLFISKGEGLTRT